MPSFSSQLLLTNAASSSGLIPLADIDLIKGAFKVYPNLGTLQNESVTFFTNKQVVMTGDTGRLYQTTITPPDFENTFEDSASFTEFSFTGLTANVPVGTISGSSQIAELGYLTSASAAAAGFGSGGGASIPNGTISGSQQITDLGFINQSQTSSMSVLSALTASFVGNLNYDYITNLPNLISSSTQIALLGAGILSSSTQIASDISGAFTSLSSSFASRITALEGAGGGNGIFTLTGSFYSTTNNIQITGSLSVGSGSFKSFEVSSDGFIILGDMDKDLNNAPEGTIAYSGSSFYLIS